MSPPEYAYHYQGHMPIGPSCAVADVMADGALVLANPQDAYLMRTKLQSILGLLNRPVAAWRSHRSTSYHGWFRGISLAAGCLVC